MGTWRNEGRGGMEEDSREKRFSSKQSEVSLDAVLPFLLTRY